MPMFLQTFIGKLLKRCTRMFNGAKFTGLESTNDVLKRGGHQQVLLLQTKFTTFEHVIVGIQHTGDVFCHIAVNHRLNVLSVVEELYF